MALGDPPAEMTHHFEECSGPIFSANTIAGDLLMLRTWRIEDGIVVFRGPYLE